MYYDNCICCYLDILGFSNYTRKYELSDSIRLLVDFTNGVFYGEKELAGRLKSIEHLHPISDGVFIIGKDPDEFIKDVSSLVAYAYLSKADSYLCTKDDDVSKVEVSIVNISGPSKIEERHWFPALFSGGIATGELAVFEQCAMLNNCFSDVNNYAGKSLTECAKLEKMGHSDYLHGARIFLEESFVQSLGQKTREKYVLDHGESEKHVYELLWPAALFEDANTLEVNINGSTIRLFSTLARFYRQFKDDTKLEAVYFNTLKLIYVAQKKYLDYFSKYCNATQFEVSRAEETLSNQLNCEGLQDIALDYSNMLSWRKGK